MKATDDLSFLPDEYLAARRRARANRLCGSLLAIVIVGVAGAFWWAEHSLETLRAQHADVTATFDREADRLRRLDELLKQQESVRHRAALAEALVERVPRAELLAELTDLLPTNTSLSEVMMSSRVRPIVKTPEQALAEKQAERAGKPSPTRIEPKRYDTTLRLGGLAYTDVQVAQFINRLSRSPFFDDVNLLVSREFTVDGQLVRKFEVEMRVRPEPSPARDRDAAGDSVAGTGGHQ